MPDSFQVDSSETSYLTFSQEISDDFMGCRRFGVEKVMAFAGQERQFRVANSLC
jgi:hypothetical protein